MVTKLLYSNIYLLLWGGLWLSDAAHTKDPSHFKESQLAGPGKDLSLPEAMEYSAANRMSYVLTCYQVASCVSKALPNRNMKNPSSSGQVCFGIFV